MGFDKATAVIFSRGKKRVIAICVAIALVVAPGAAFATSATPSVGLFVSASANHAGARLLSRASIFGPVYVFLGNTPANIASVAFHFDDPTGVGVVRQTATIAPYNFPLDVTRVTAGTHTVLAVITDTSGTFHDLFARFRVTAPPSTTPVVVAPASTTTTPVTTVPGVSSTARCVAPGGGQLDLDPTDPPDGTWQHTPGQKLTVYFKANGLSARYLNAVQKGAAAWSLGPCVSGKVVSQCPANAPCVPVVESAQAPGGGVDGQFDSNTNGNNIVSGTLNLYISELDKESDAGILVTITHEMGHAFGLTHRNATTDLMNASSAPTVSPIPDATDYHNLAVLFG